MVRRYLMTFSVLLAGLLSQGCFNSQSDYDRLAAERDGLAAELESANRENLILNQALDSIKKEQERLQLMLNTARSQQKAAVSPNTQPAPPLPPLAGDTPTMSWGGYDWSIPPDTLANRPSETGSTAPTGVAQSPPPASEPSGRIYRPKSGDVLSGIAARHNTTVERLVELNPYLARRNNYMIHLTDKIVLP